MIVTFILGVLAGWFAKLAEPRVKSGLAQADRAEAPGTVEVPLLALASLRICMTWSWPTGLYPARAM